MTDILICKLVIFYSQDIFFVIEKKKQKILFNPNPRAIQFERFKTFITILEDLDIST